MNEILSPQNNSHEKANVPLGRLDRSDSGNSRDSSTDSLHDRVKCEDCNDTGIYETTLHREGIEIDAPVFCDCEIGEKLSTIF